MCSKFFILSVGNIFLKIMYVTWTWEKPCKGIVTVLLKWTDAPVVRGDFLTSFAWKIMIYNYAIAS